MKPFDFYRCPRVVFGPGRIAELGRLAAYLGSRALVVTGESSLDRSGNWNKVARTLGESSIVFKRFAVTGEPSPDLVDGAVRRFKHQEFHLVLAIGGGSVIDCAKAIAAMLPLGDPVTPYLEGVGDRKHPGTSLPLIAVPTTAGTGSEATRNAVLSRVGREGFKKSLRHDTFTPVCALLDPELTLTCPPSLTAACGMDAFTQLLESYLSLQASPVTDALSLSGIELLSPALVPAATGRGEALHFRSALLYAAFLSGVTLANAGLGIIHGLAGPIGALVPMPHGMVCAALAGEACRANIRRLREEGGEENPMLARYARVGRILSGNHGAKDEQACELLLENLEHWAEKLGIPRLGHFGVADSDIDGLAAQAGQKANPVHLQAEDVRTILRACL